MRSVRKKKNLDITKKENGEEKRKIERKINYIKEREK